MENIPPLKSTLSWIWRGKQQAVIDDIGILLFLFYFHLKKTHTYPLNLLQGIYLEYGDTEPGL